METILNNEINRYYDDIFKVEQKCHENKFLKSPPGNKGKFKKQLKFNRQRYATKFPYVKDLYTLPKNYLIGKIRL